MAESQGYAEKRKLAEDGPDSIFRVESTPLHVTHVSIVHYMLDVWYVRLTLDIFPKHQGLVKNARPHS